MNDPFLGAACAFGTAACWCISALAFEEAGRRAGSVPVNFWRLLMACTLLAVAASITRGMPLPVDATAHQWQWLLLSGLMGFFVGDITLFRAFVLMGARLTTLITCTAPMFTLVAELIVFPSTRITAMHLAGVLVTIGGVGWVVLERHDAGRPIKVTTRAVLLALCGAAGQGVGAVLTAKAFEQASYDAFSAGQIRMLAALPAFACFIGLTGRVRDTAAVLSNAPALGLLALGAFWGPFLGVTLFIQSLNYVSASTTQTITSLVPVLIIPLAIFIRKEHVSPRAALGGVVAVAGVWLLIHGSGR